MQSTSNGGITNTVTTKFSVPNILRNTITHNSVKTSNNNKKNATDLIVIS